MYVNVCHVTRKFALKSASDNVGTVVSYHDGGLGNIHTRVSRAHSCRATAARTRRLSAASLCFFNDDFLICNTCSWAFFSINKVWQRVSTNTNCSSRLRPRVGLLRAISEARVHTQRLFLKEHRPKNRNALIHVRQRYTKTFTRTQKRSRA